jgi:hypothetical protein
MDTSRRDIIAQIGLGSAAVVSSVAADAATLAPITIGSAPERVSTTSRSFLMALGSPDQSSIGRRRRQALLHHGATQQQLWPTYV